MVSTPRIRGKVLVISLDALADVGVLGGHRLGHKIVEQRIALLILVTREATIGTLGEGTKRAAAVHVADHMSYGHVDCCSIKMSVADLQIRRERGLGKRFRQGIRSQTSSNSKARAGGASPREDGFSRRYSSHHCVIVTLIISIWHSRGYGMKPFWGTIYVCTSLSPCPSKASDEG